MQHDGAALGLQTRSRLWVSCVMSAAVSDYHHGNALSRAILSLWKGPGTHNYDTVNVKSLCRAAAMDTIFKCKYNNGLRDRPVMVLRDVIRARTAKLEILGNIRLGWCASLRQG